MTPPEQDELAPGTQFGAYRINRLLGRGGMGAVYEAQHLADGRIVALKLLSVDLDKMDARERFLREGRTAALINHPNAVYIYGTEEIDGAPAITMELVPGGTLEEKVVERGPLPVAESIEDILQVIDGLDAALAAGVLHRDVKPSNCFVGAHGVVKIGDFGLSKPVDGEEQNKLTKTGLFLGTPVYSSPEQLLGETLDVRSDIYAVGVTWYHLLTGKLPYQSSGSMMQVVAAVLNGAPVQVGAMRKDVSENVAAVVMKSMARKAEDRFQSYAEFREAVAALRPRESTSAGLWDRTRAWVVDSLVLMFAAWLVMTPGLMIAGVTKNSDDPTQQWIRVFVGLTLVLIIQAIPEGLRGATLGKWLVGIRVNTVDGQLPGYARAAARVAILWSTDLASLSVRSALTTPNEKLLGLLLTTVVLRGLLFVTVRKGKGLVLLHDVLTGTRVVRPLGSIGQRRTDFARAQAPTLAGSEARIGPYVVLGPAMVGSSVMRGWDDAMQRNLWIVPALPNTPETPAARRNLARLSRLRWVAGRRTPDENWDAYEAPSGEQLSARLTRAVPWSDQQTWMLDLTSEFQEATKDGTVSPVEDVDSLWITPTNRVVIPEGLIAASGSDSTSQQTTDSGVAFIARFIRRIQESNRGVQQLPRHAVNVIQKAERASTVADIQRVVKETLGRPVFISQLRRFGLMAATLVPLVGCPVIGGIGVDQQQRRDPVGWTMQGLADFIADSNHVKGELASAGKVNTDTANARTIGVKLGRTARLLKVPFLYPDQYRPDVAVRRRETFLSEVYIASKLPGRSPDTSKISWPKTVKEVAIANRIRARHTSIDSAEVRAARALVDSTWKGRPPGTGIALSQRLIPLVTGVVTAAFFAFCSLLIAITIRRGPLLRGFQLDAVDKNGKLAGRLRMFLRSLITWSPFILPTLFVYKISSASDGTGAAMAPVLFIVLPIVWIVGLVSAIRRPDRGLAERLSGTWLVPE